MNTATMYNKGNNSTNNNNSSTSNLNVTIKSNNGTTSNPTSNTSGGGGGSTTDRIEWSRATILDFIEDYRRQRVLWDPNTKGYHIKQTKYEALKLLGHKYGAEIRSIRSKIKSLRSSFHREHGKVLNGRRKGLNYQPMWFAYDAIRFILDGESGDSDEAEGQKNDSNNRETALSEPNNNNSNNNNNASNNSIDEELMEERKISSRDIEHFNNHFLALGLQARHPMAVIAAVEAAAAASAAQERRQEQKYALKQQEIDAATQLKLLELSTNATITTAANTNTSNNNNNTMNLTSTSATFNPISKPFNSPKSSSPLATATNSSVPITTATLSNTTTTPPQQQLPPPPSATSTCSPESLTVLHGSRSLDENSASALAAATAIPSLSITAVARNSDFDGSEYCNISADDVKTEIFESDSTELAMLESTRTSTPVPLNYHKNATDLTMNRSNIANMSHGSGIVNNPASVAINGGSGTVGSRKRKAQMHSNVNHNEDAPSPSKLHQKQQQHSNAIIHSRQCDYLNSNNNSNNINNNQSPDDNADDDDDDGDDDEDDGAGYSTSFSHLQTTLINNNSSNNNNNPTTSNNSKTIQNCTNNPIDEYGVFGEYVAITIRKLKTSKAKIVVKHLINNLLYEAEMGKYDQGISSCKEPPELYKM